MPALDPQGALAFSHPYQVNGWTIPDSLALEYAANVLSEHAPALRTGLLPNIEEQWRLNKWNLALHMAGVVRESFRDDGTLEEPLHFEHLPGIGRLRDWSMAELLLPFFEPIKLEHQRLTELFINNGKDLTSAIEWAELMQMANVIYLRAYPSESDGDLFKSEITCEAEGRYWRAEYPLAP